jgi:hypothetical protein
VQGNAVRAGALQSALLSVRHDVFGLVSPTTPSLPGSRRSAEGSPAGDPDLSNSSTVSHR